MSINALVDSLSTSLSLLETIALKFESMPRLEISPDLDVSSLIEQAGKNSTEVGTLLLSEGSPVAAILSTEQYKGVHYVISTFSSIISTLRNAFISQEEALKGSVGLLKETGGFLNEAGDKLCKMPIFILIGTVATAAGAFFLGKRYQEAKNDQTKSKISYIMPGTVLAVGLGVLAFSAHRGGSLGAESLAITTGIISSLSSGP